MNTKKINNKKPRNYFREYYNSHKESILESQKKYKQSPKGKLAEKRYESKPSRRKAKTEWMRKHRAKQKRSNKK